MVQPFRGQTWLVLRYPFWRTDTNSVSSDLFTLSKIRHDLHHNFVIACSSSTGYSSGLRHALNHWIRVPCIRVHKNGKFWPHDNTLCRILNVNWGHFDLIRTKQKGTFHRTWSQHRLFLVYSKSQKRKDEHEHIYSYRWIRWHLFTRQLEGITSPCSLLIA